MTQTLVDTRSSHESTSSFDTPIVGESLRDGQGVGSATPGLTPEAVAPAVGDVSSVVVKAKKAAQSLWVLMHAQVSYARHTRQGMSHSVMKTFDFRFGEGG